MRDGEPQIYTALAAMRNGYMQTQWARVQMFLVFNTVAFPLVFGTSQPEEVKLLISLVGFLMHVILLQATLRADTWIGYIDARMVELENLDQSDTMGTRVKVFGHSDFAVMRHSWWASRRTFGFFGVIVAVVWIWQSISHIYTIVG